MSGLADVRRENEQGETICFTVDKTALRRLFIYVASNGIYESEIERMQDDIENSKGTGVFVLLEIAWGMLYNEGSKL